MTPKPERTPRPRPRPKKWMVVWFGAIATAILAALWIAAE